MVVGASASTQRVRDIEGPRRLNRAFQPFNTAIAVDSAAVGASAVAQDLTAATQPIFAPRTEAIAKKHFRVSAAAFSDATSGTLDEIRKAVRKFKFTTPDGVRLPAREEQQLAQAIHNTRMAGDLNKLFELYETAVATRKLRSEVAGVGTLEFADSPAGPASIPKGFVQVPGVPSTRQDLTVYAEEASTVRGKRVRVKLVRFMLFQVLQAFVLLRDRKKTGRLFRKHFVPW
jgi:hypothetical protein